MNNAPSPTPVKSRLALKKENKPINAIAINTCGMTTLRPCPRSRASAQYKKMMERKQLARSRVSADCSVLYVLMAERHQRQRRCQDDDRHDRRRDDQKAGYRRVGEFAHSHRCASHLCREGHGDGDRQAIEARDEDER